MGFFTFRIEEQRTRIGQKFGTSDWVLITQDMTDTFGRVTLDPDPMHVDPEWCRDNSPYVGTVAFGFQTMSMLTYLFHTVLQYDKRGSVSTGGYPLNYGFDRMRLTGPVPIGSRIRAHFTLKDVREHGPGELIQTVHTEVEVEGRKRPALVADWLFIWVTEAGHRRIIRGITDAG